jgi:hypothetical protein
LDALNSYGSNLDDIVGLLHINLKSDGIDFDLENIVLNDDLMGHE